MLAEEGYADTRVEVNSVGDRDSLARFGRELIAYYRKNINEMTPECRQLLKRDPFELLASRDESCKALNEHAPRAMDFLSEASRHHLEEVLEYLEALKIPYAVNNGLIGNRSYCTETIFTIIDAGPTGKSGKDSSAHPGSRPALQRPGQAPERKEGHPRRRLVAPDQGQRQGLARSP